VKLPGSLSLPFAKGGLEGVWCETTPYPRRLCHNYIVEKRGFLRWPIKNYFSILGVKPLFKMSIFTLFSNYDTVSRQWGTVYLNPRQRGTAPRPPLEKGVTDDFLISKGSCHIQYFLDDVGVYGNFLVNFLNQVVIDFMKIFLHRCYHDAPHFYESR
jgi:hypothetical protein